MPYRSYETLIGLDNAAAALEEASRLLAASITGGTTGNIDNCGAFVRASKAKVAGALGAGGFRQKASPEGRDYAIAAVA